MGDEKRLDLEALTRAAEAAMQCMHRRRVGTVWHDGHGYVCVAASKDVHELNEDRDRVQMLLEAVPRLVERVRELEAAVRLLLDEPQSVTAQRLARTALRPGSEGER